MKKRVVGYDIIKSMAMFFVVMLHYSFYTRFYSSGLAGTAVTVLCVVCVPLFFAVNGALLLPRKMDEAKHYRKTLNIVIVVTIWRLLAAAFFVFVDGSHPVTLKDLVLFLLGGGFGLLIQRYQHATHGTNLTVENGYWLLPSFVATILILLVLGRVNIQGIWAKVFQVIGMNTFGVYMLHLVGLVLLSRLQALPWLQFMGNLNSVAVTLLNVVLCGCVFAICLAVSVLFRKIPYINRLFAL